MRVRGHQRGTAGPLMRTCQLDLRPVLMRLSAYPQARRLGYSNSTGRSDHPYCSPRIISCIS
jgi:hypothetical protein